MKNNFLQQMAKVLELALESCEGNISELARRLDTNKAKVSHWKNQKSLPNLESASQLAEMTGAQIVLPNQSIRDYARLLQVRDFDAHRHATAKRMGENVPQSVLEYCAQKKHKEPDVLFSLDLLEHIGIDAADALLFEAESDSMAPVICKGDMALIDKKRTAIDDGKIYLVHTEAYFLLRRISRDLGGEIILHTDKSTASIRVPQEGREQMTIIGQVVWIGKKL